MIKTNHKSQARKSLDSRLAALGPADRFVAPPRGWIRAIRDALGMTAADLAQRLGVSGASVRSMEESEASHGIRLSTLERAATAMDCTLVYAFIPNRGLDQTVYDQAERVVRGVVERGRHTMELEDQGLADSLDDVERQIWQVMESRSLWSHGGNNR